MTCDCVPEEGSYDAHDWYGGDESLAALDTAVAERDLAKEIVRKLASQCYVHLDFVDAEGVPRYVAYPHDLANYGLVKLSSEESELLGEILNSEET